MRKLVASLSAIAALWAITLVCVSRFDSAAGVDFYHYWGVAKAVRAGGLEGLDFYTSPESMTPVLREMARESGDPRQVAVTARRELLHLTGTPTQYWLFSILPAPYSAAFALFVTLLTASLAGAMILLFRAYGFGVVLSLPVAAVVVLAYPPFRFDFDVGNVNSFQLLLLSALAVWIGRRGGQEGHRARVVVWILPVLTALLLIKPSILLPAIALALVAARGAPSRRKLAALGVSAVVAVTVAVLPLLYFRTWKLWGGWLEYVSGGRDEGLLFPTAWGNRSTVVLLHEGFGIRPSVAALLAGAIFVVLAVVGAVFRKETRLVARVTASMREVLDDPFRAATAGVLLTCSTSIVYWPHYYLFCLWGALAMTLSLRRRPVPRALALLAIALSSGLLGPLFAWLDTPGLSLHAVAASWTLITPLVFLDGHE